MQNDCTGAQTAPNPPDLKAGDWVLAPQLGIKGSIRSQISAVIESNAVLNDEFGALRIVPIAELLPIS